MELITIFAGVGMAVNVLLGGTVFIRNRKKEDTVAFEDRIANRVELQFSKFEIALVNKLEHIFPRKEELVADTAVAKTRLDSLESRVAALERAKERHESREK